MGKDYGEVAVTPARKKWSAGDLARKGFVQRRGDYSGDLYSSWFLPTNLATG